MKIHYARGVFLALGLSCGLALEARAENYGAPSLLPLPEARQSYGVQPVGFGRSVVTEAGQPDLAPAAGAPTPAPQAIPSPESSEPISPYESTVWGNGSGCTGSGNSCAIDDCCNPCTCWWTGANFLWMGRDREDYHQLSFDTSNPMGAVLDTDSATMNFSPGVEVYLGRWFCGGAYGIEAKYWGVFGGDNEQTVTNANVVGGLNTVYDFRTLNIGALNVNDDIYDNAGAHRVRRDYQFHNVELNLLQGYAYNNCGAFSVNYLAGLRYFRFEEGFQYAASQTSPVFGTDPSNEAYYDIDVDNNLIGVQLGATGAYSIGCVRLHATPKVGVYNNFINHSQRIYNIDGVAVVGPGNPTAGTPYDINSDKNDVSFLAEINLGVDYQVSRRWSLNLGYRAVAITGIAMATTQIPPSFADIPGAENIDNDESMILHGGYAGATFSW